MNLRVCTKIVCTIGPASRDAATLEKMILAGMNVARLNFSHGTQEDHAEVISHIREIAGRLGKPVAILQDLSGPKLRIEGIAGGSVNVETGNVFTLTTRKVPGDAREVGISYSDLPGRMNRGDRMLLADGALELEVVESSDTDITCHVIVGGTLSSHKGINLPTRTVDLPSMTEKDREDLLFGIEHGVDYVAISFVRSAADVLEARNFMGEQGAAVPLMAKIEKHEAMEHAGEIVEVSDGILIARGDLGVETPLERVPLAQKELIRLANRAAKPVITATQMLRSMVESPRPTRAEVADVANAILDGTDAVMLSEETAVGRYPVETVEMMTRIARNTETAFPYDTWEGRVRTYSEIDVPEAVAHAACDLARSIASRCIVTFTWSGTTARLVAKYRPDRTIVAPTPREKTYRQLALVWGVVPVLTEHEVGTDAMFSYAVSAARGVCEVERGECVVITAGVPMGNPGGTNLIKAELVQ